jgi:hypothetical protein
VNVKMRVLVTLSTALLLACSGCAGKVSKDGLPFPAQQPVEYRNEADELMVVCTLTALEIEHGDEGKQDNVSATLLLENKSDVALMRISCESDFIDASGEVIENAACSCDYHKNPMQPGETREYHVSRWIHEGERVFDIALAITKVVTIEEEPPLPEPKLGEDLFRFYQRDDIAVFADDFYGEMPVKAVVFMDSWNKAEVELSDPDDIMAVFEAMKQIRVEKQSDVYVTDNYNKITFILADGREFGFSFNRYNLDYDDNVYKISGDKGLWELLRGILDE